MVAVQRSEHGWTQETLAEIARLRCGPFSGWKKAILAAPTPGGRSLARSSFPTSISSTRITVTVYLTRT